MREDIMLAYNHMKNPGKEYGYGREENASVLRIHRMLPMYNETPLIRRSEDADRYRIQAVLIKDESKRFGLKAFKGLGGFYALFTVICRRLGLDEKKVTLKELLSGAYYNEIQKMTFITTTDGNHGKGISWAAGIFGCPSYVFMPKGTVEARAQAVRDAGTAKVEILDKTYDECVAYTAALAKEHDWILVQDTSWEGYTEIPELIMKGYTTMLYEALDQMKAAGYDHPTHVFVQAGVGSMAAAVAAGIAQTYPQDCPVICSLEPHGASCIHESIAKNDGNAYTAEGNGITIMAGLNCGTPCSIAWDILKETLSFAISCDDELTRRGMRLLAKAEDPKQRIVAGESGAVGPGILDAIMTEEKYQPLKEQLQLDENSVVLIFNTEGDTDPEGYCQTVNQTGCSENDKPEIRFATDADLTEISEIYDRIHTREEAGESTIGWKREIYPTKETARAAIDAGDMYVETVKGKVVACGRINQIQMPEYAKVDWTIQAEDDQVLVLHTLVVDPLEEKKGYAGYFLRFYEELAEKKHCSALRIDTNEKNKKARAMYKKLEYVERGIIPCEFNGIQGVNLVCMEKGVTKSQKRQQ